MTHFLNLFDLEMLFLAEHLTVSVQHTTLWEMLPYINRVNLLTLTALYYPSASLIPFMLLSWKETGDQNCLC